MMRLWLGMIVWALALSCYAALPANCTSTTASIGTASTSLVSGGQNFASLTVQNTHASQVLYLSFNATVTTADLALAAGASLTFAQFAPANTLYALGSGAATTVAVVGCKQ